MGTMSERENYLAQVKFREDVMSSLKRIEDRLSSVEGKKEPKSQALGYTTNLLNEVHKIKIEHCLDDTNPYVTLRTIHGQVNHVNEWEVIESNNNDLTFKFKPLFSGTVHLLKRN